MELLFLRNIPERQENIPCFQEYYLGKIPRRTSLGQARFGSSHTYHRCSGTPTGLQAAAGAVVDRNRRESQKARLSFGGGRTTSTRSPCGGRRRQFVFSVFRAIRFSKHSTKQRDDTAKVLTYE